jgi:hypothetical protein
VLSGAATPAAFRALTLGGELIIPRGMVMAQLARGDTLRATTPASFALDLKRGPVVFFADGRDSLQISVGGNPYGMLDPVRATGRRLVVHLALVGNGVVIDRR